MLFALLLEMTKLSFREGVEAACPAREEKEALWVAVMPVWEDNWRCLSLVSFPRSGTLEGPKACQLPSHSCGTCTEQRGGKDPADAKTVGAGGLVLALPPACWPGARMLLPRDPLRLLQRLQPLYSGSCSHAYHQPPAAGHWTLGKCGTYLVFIFVMSSLKVVIFLKKLKFRHDL